MDGNFRAKRRRSLGALMGVVAILAVAFGVTRPLWTPATIRAARDVLRSEGPGMIPGFSPDQFRADSVVKTPGGFRRVRFVRIAGSGWPGFDVVVPEDAVREARFRTW